MALFMALIGSFHYGNIGYCDLARQTLAMVVVPSMIGARGLGLEVMRGINRMEVVRGFQAGRKYCPAGNYY